MSLGTGVLGSGVLGSESVTAAPVTPTYPPEHQVGFTTESAIGAYTEQQTGFTTESALNAYQVHQTRFTTQSALNVWKIHQVKFITQSALLIYKNWQVGFTTQSALPVIKTAQVGFVTQSALQIYKPQQVGFVTQSSILVISGHQVGFTTQSALDAVTKYYGYALNLITGALSKLDDFEFNSLSGDMGADYNGIYTLTGTTNKGAAIPAFIETGLLDFNDPNLKHIFDSYTDYKGGSLKLTVITDNGEVHYTLPVTTRLKTIKRLIARGARGRYWKFILENVAGSSANVESLGLDVQVTRRKI